MASTFTYDNAGRHKTSVGGFGGFGGTRTYTYDNADRLTGVARGSETFAYGYDADGRQATSTRAGQTVALAYDEADNLARLTYPTGTGYSEGRNYDRAGRLIAVSSSKASVVLSRFDVIRDGVGNPTRVKSTRSAVVTDESYLYDQNDRLTKVCNTPVCDATATATIAYGYDKSGNRLTETRLGVPSPGVTTNVYDDADQLSTSTKGGATTSYTWDADGNLKTAGSAMYTFDAANRLRSRVSGATTYTASYDGDGHRAQIAVTGQTAKNLAWDLNGELPMLAVQSIGTARTAIRYTETGIPMEVIAGTQATPTDYAWLTHDHMGSVVDTITAAGVPETKSTYEPFGAATRTKLDPAALETLLGYTGERLDPTLGLVHLRARDYDPTQGRFLATDPLTPAIGDPYVASYVYAANQPSVYTDPSGRSVVDDYLNFMEGLWIVVGFEAREGGRGRQRCPERNGRIQRRPHRRPLRLRRQGRHGHA